MNLRLLHRRLAVLMSIAGLVAFGGGAGVEPFSAILAAITLVVALFWHPDPELSDRMERLWLPLATILVARALLHVFVIQDDVVIPVVDLLLLLLAAEALRTLEAPNDLRLYALSFALILASTAYRPGIVFLVAFVAYVGLATVALMVGHLRRRAEAHQVREVPLGRGLMTTTAALSGVILLVAAVVFVAVPRVSQGWAGRGETLATTIAGFSDQVSIGEHGSMIYGNPEIVLRVEFPDGAPDQVLGLHWRGRSYDRFDGIRWTRSNDIPASMTPTSWFQAWGPERIEQEIFAAPLDTRVLFALHPTLDIDSENGVQAIFDNAGDYTYWGSSAPAYTARSVAQAPSPAELRAASTGYTPSRTHYLQLPRLDPRIGALADSLTAGATTRYDRVAAVRDYLKSFAYTRVLPATAAEATLHHFLFERQAGHCEYFSTAMVVLLRSAGIHARNVNGFLGGQWSDFGNYLVVTQNEAHSWVEVWFPEYGWVTFDPTPSGVGGGEVQTSWFWPGRILFDGLQHRWSKWVLDYDAEDQIGVLSGLFERRTVEQSEGTGGQSTTPSPWGAILVALVILAGIVWLRRGGPPMTPATRSYVALRDSCTRAGIEVSAGTTPLALGRALRTSGRLSGAGSGGAVTAAERIIDMYLRARYGREELGERDLDEMDAALRVVRRTLKASGR